MDYELDIEGVAQDLPSLDAVLDDPRVRPTGLVGGFTIVLVGALLQLAPVGGFWTNAVSGSLVFIGVPLFCVGLAAAEPQREGDPFRLGIQLDRAQRRLVATGATLILLAPAVLGSLAMVAGYEPWVVFLAATVALLGAVLTLTGFVAWTSSTLAETQST